MLIKITAVEAKLFFREPGAWLLTILLPTFVLVGSGSCSAVSRTRPSAATAGSTSTRPRWSS